MLAERSTDHDSEIESNSSCDQSISGDDDATGQISTDNSNEDGRSDGENGYDNCLPLFKDSSLSVPEFNAILLALKQRHNFSNLALDSILKMFQMCLPEESNLPYKSSYLFEQKIEKELMYTSTKYLTCMSCQTLLTSDLLCENQICTHYRECGKGEDSSVFYTIDILPELKRLIPGKFTVLVLWVFSGNIKFGIIYIIVEPPPYEILLISYRFVDSSTA